MTRPTPDDRLRFYFERQEVIDQWAELPRLGRRFADGFYASILPAVEAHASSVGVDATSWAIGSDQLIGLHRPEWLGADGQPRVTVALGWKREQASLTGDGAAWVGIRVRRSGTHAALSGHLMPILADTSSLDVLGDTDPDGRLWPRWHRVRWDEPKVWDHLDAYAASIVEDLAGAWRLASPVIDEALTSAPPP